MAIAEIVELQMSIMGLFYKFAACQQNVKCSCRWSLEWAMVVVLYRDLSILMIRGETIRGVPQFLGLRQEVSPEDSSPTTGPLSTARILVVEDDRAVQKALKRLFEAEGFAVQIASDGQAALEAFRITAPAAIVLDLRLPLRSGREVCQEIKQHAPALPIIVLSAASDVSDKVLLLELGADDYVTKPFSPRELLARVRAALRRTSSKSASKGTVSFDGIIIDFSKMEVVRQGESIALTAQEFKTLKFLVQNPERVISRDELLNVVWGYHNYPSTRTVDNHILKLRQKLEADPANPIHFRTVHGTGYKFVP
jgi:DNA-binding response OmpR family regulator